MSGSKLKNKAQNVKAVLPDQEKGNRKQPKKFYPLHNFDKIKKKTILGGDILLTFVSFLSLVSLIGSFIFAIKALIDRLRGNESKTSKRLTFILLGLTVGFFFVIGLVTEESKELKALKAETDKMLEEIKNSPMAKFDERSLTSDLLKVIENSQGSITDIRPALDDWEAVQVIVANEMRLFNEDQRGYFVSEIGPIVKSIIMNHGASKNPLIVFRYHNGDKMGEYF